MHAFLHSPVFLVAAAGIVQVVCARLVIALLSRFSEQVMDREKKRSIAAQVAMILPKIYMLLSWRVVRAPEDWTAEYSYIADRYW